MIYFQPTLPTQVSAYPHNLVFPAAWVSETFLSAVLARRTAAGSVWGDPNGTEDTLCCWPSARFIVRAINVLPTPFQASLLIASGLQSSPHTYFDYCCLSRCFLLLTLVPVRPFTPPNCLYLLPVHLYWKAGFSDYSVPVSFSWIYLILLRSEGVLCGLLCPRIDEGFGLWARSQTVLSRGPPQGGFREGSLPRGQGPALKTASLWVSCHFHLFHVFNFIYSSFLSLSKSGDCSDYLRSGNYL